MKKQTLIIFLMILLTGILHGEDSENRRKVMTWVPPYATGASLEALEASYGGLGMKDGLTHLGLQFWIPTTTGGIERVTKYDEINDSRIAVFRAWGQKHDVRILLCVYNGISGWDWELARSAFDTHREQFIDSLVQETLRLKLDGVDIDLEGIGNLDASKDAFIAFIRDLSDRLHEHGKILTVDSFPYIWNAPNRSWWPELLPLVDGLNAMGYTNTGVKADGWKSYESLKSAAGEQASKLLIGMASYKAEWEGSSADEHLEWIVNNPSVGVAIWDAQLKDPSWRTVTIWEKISEIRGNQ